MDDRLRYLRQRRVRRGGAGAVDPFAGVTKDSTSNQYVPADASEWSTFISAAGLNLAVPDYLHLCQEASGNLADSIGTLTLTANATPLYQQTVPGWTRVGVAGTGATASQRFQSTSGPNPSTTSVARFAWISIGAVNSGIRDVLSNGSTNDTSIQASTTGGNKYLRYTEGTNNASTVSTSYTDTPIPILFVIDVTNSRARLFTPYDKLSPTYGAAANNTNYTIGGANATFAAVTVIYEAGWQGADAEISDADAKALLESFGYTIGWT